MHSQNMGEACTRCFAITLDFVLRAKGTETIQNRNSSAFFSSLHAPSCALVL